MPRALAPRWSVHTCEGQERAVFTWTPPVPMVAVASGPLGGGIGRREWILHATVPAGYTRDDPGEHLRELAAACSLGGPGAGLLTAVDVRRAVWATDGGVEVLATVGLGWPCWAADADGTPNPYAPGTVNVVAWLPERLADAALVNAVATVAEAKAQALGDAGVPGTGTASDAVVLCCPAAGEPSPFGGPRSTWGAPLARAVHRAVLAGAPEDERVPGHGGVSRVPRPLPRGAPAPG